MSTEVGESRQAEYSVTPGADPELYPPAHHGAWRGTDDRADRGGGRCAQPVFRALPGGIEGPRGLDIDHLVPLAEAWDSGASGWTAKEREDYANDLGDDRALIAVSAASNRSKADQDPTTWLPPAQVYRCQYVTDWVADKTRWGLSIDAGEQAALTEELSRCPDVSVTVTLAR